MQKVFTIYKSVKIIQINKQYQQIKIKNLNSKKNFMTVNQMNLKIKENSLKKKIKKKPTEMINHYNKLNKKL